MAGRPSKLTEQQWLTITERAMAGESVRALAREYKMSEASLRGRIPAIQKKLEDVASQIVATNQALAELSISAQLTAQRLADEMRSISTNLAGAGKYGSIIAKKVMQTAAKQVEKVNEDDPMESADVLQGISALSRIANESSTIGFNMVRLAKDSADESMVDNRKAQQLSRIVLVDGSAPGVTAKA